MILGSRVIVNYYDRNINLIINTYLLYYTTHAIFEYIVTRIATRNDLHETTIHFTSEPESFRHAIKSSILRRELFTFNFIDWHSSWH